MFQVAQCLVLLIFVVCIADLRRKRGMRPLVSERLILGVQLCAPIPIGLYGSVLCTVESPLLSDSIALVHTACGTLLAVKAKVDLGHQYTWVGYDLENGTLCTTGVYAVIRHPLYTGIVLFILGALLTIIPHASWVLPFIVLVTVTAMTSFLIVVARQETKWLAHQYPAQFAAYREHVHAFLPRRPNRMSNHPSEK